MKRFAWLMVLGLASLVAAGFALGMISFGSMPLARTATARVGATRDRAPARGALIVPVEGVSRAQLVDSWHDARDGGARLHEALDIPAPGGTEVIAAMAGIVEKLFESKAGGTTAYVRSDDGKWIAYYAHLQRYADGLAEGQHVAQGSPIGFVGDTGNAGAGNYHLHFAMQRMQPGEKWYEGSPVDPFPLLAGQPAAH